MQIMWFRKDLRILDNPALTQACQAGRVTAVYFITPQQWQYHDVAPIQLDFLEKTLQKLADALATLGIEFIVQTLPSFDHIPQALSTLCQQIKATRVVANSEVELDEINRDIKVQHQGINLKLYQGDCILNAGQVLTRQGTMFKVFTPFKNNWLKQVAALDLCPDPQPKKQQAPLLATQINIDMQKKDSRAWEAGEEKAHTKLSLFLDESLTRYDQERDFPANPGTSNLSPYLALGVISVKQCLNALLQRYPHALENRRDGPSTWVNELVWREFYRHIMLLNPRLCMGHNYNELGNHIQWQNDLHLFYSWCEGKTGYPLVDAAMRQLVTTGWMHNRLRMICASFLTKDLLVDWRWGEAFFKRHLIDGDFASNNGGWQWAASTGCDAQPYFRIFNPIIQSQRFDPQGQFISTYLPALSHLNNKLIHLPQQPIVEHKLARLKALEIFSVLKKRA